MARSRMIKPEFWDDEKLAMQTSRDARLTFIGLWNHSDDYGVVKGNVTWLKNHIFPYEDSLSAQEFAGWLTELEKGAWIIPFNGSGEKFYFIRNFSKHQTVNRPSQQRNPVPPDDILQYSRSTHGALIDETETETETETEEEVAKPSIESDIITLCDEIAKQIDKRVFNPYSFNNKNKRKRPEARFKTLTRCKEELGKNNEDFKADPWPYLEHILKVEHQNANEAEVIVEHEKRKQEEQDAAGALRALV
jgi:hypothetical protein